MHGDFHVDLLKQVCLRRRSERRRRRGLRLPHRRLWQRLRPAVLPACPLARGKDILEAAQLEYGPCVLHDPVHLLRGVPSLTK